MKRAKPDWDGFLMPVSWFSRWRNSSTVEEPSKPTTWEWGEAPELANFLRGCHGVVRGVGKRSKAAGFHIHVQRNLSLPTVDWSWTEPSHSFIVNVLRVLSQAAFCLCLSFLVHAVGSEDLPVKHHMVKHSGIRAPFSIPTLVRPLPPQI